MPGAMIGLTPVCVRNEGRSDGGHFRAQLMTTASSVCMRVIIIHTALEPWVMVVALSFWRNSDSECVVGFRTTEVRFTSGFAGILMDGRYISSSNSEDFRLCTLFRVSRLSCQYVGMLEVGMYFHI